MKMKSFILMLFFGFLSLNLSFTAILPGGTPTPDGLTSPTPMSSPTLPSATTSSPSIQPPYYDKEILPPGVNRFPDDDGILMNENFDNSSYIWENHGYNGYWDIVSGTNGNKTFNQMNTVPDLNYAVNGSLSWDIYLYQVKAHTLTNLSNNDRFDDVLYFFFHYLDDQNYYAFRIDAAGNVTVIKKKNGISTQTQPLGAVFIPGETYQITKAYMYYIVAWEDSFELWMDGLYICDWQENDMMLRGKVGIGTSACTAEFDDVLVIDLNEKLLQIPAYRTIVYGRYNKIGAPGQYNMDQWVPTDPLFVLGNGTKDIPSNALTVYKNGNTEINGDLSVAGELTYNGKAPITDVNPDIAPDGTLTLTLSNGITKTAGKVGNVEDASVDANGNLIIKKTNGSLSSSNLKWITSASVDTSGNLIIGLSNGGTLNAGNVIGPNGDKGVGVSSVKMDTNGILIITLTDGQVFNLGSIKGPQGPKGDTGPQGPIGLPGEPFGLKTTVLTGKIDREFLGTAYIDLPSGYNSAKTVSVTCFVSIPEESSTSSNPKYKFVPVPNFSTSSLITSFYLSQVKNSIVLTSLPSSYDGLPYTIVLYYLN